MNLLNSLRWRRPRYDHTCRNAHCQLDAGVDDLLCAACRDQQDTGNQPKARYRYTAGGNQRSPL